MVVPNEEDSVTPNVPQEVPQLFRFGPHFPGGMEAFADWFERKKKAAAAAKADDE